MHESDFFPFVSPKDRSEKGRILSLDIGDKRIGMAVSDPLGMTAQGLPTLTRKGTKQAIKAIMEIIMKYEINKVVYGLPKNMDGSLGSQAEKTEGFIQKLNAFTDCPCIPWDERLTSLHAHKTLKGARMSRKKRSTNVDRLSAVLILQNYLDLLHRSGDKR